MQSTEKKAKRVSIKDLTKSAIELIDRGVDAGLSGEEIHRRLQAAGEHPLPVVNTLRVYLRQRRGAAKLPTGTVAKQPAPVPPVAEQVQALSALYPKAPFPEAKKPAAKLSGKPQGFLVHPDGTIEAPDAQGAIELSRLLAASK